MGILRTSPLYLRNDTTIDTGAGIDVRRLQDAQSGVNDDTTTAQFTNANDNVERTFDPATGAVTNTNNAATTLFKMGWAPRLSEDMTPVDDTNCNAYLPAGDVTIDGQVTCTMTGTAPLTSGPSLTFKASLWRYNVSTDTGTLIAGAAAAVQVAWTAASIGNDLGTYKGFTITITVASAVEFLANEVLLLQVGFNTNNVPNPLTGTSTYTCVLRVNNTGTKATFGASQNIMQTCVINSDIIGAGEVTRALGVGIPRDLVGAGVLTRVLDVGIPRNLVGDGVMSRSLDVGIPRSIVGDGVVTRTVAVGINRDVVGAGVVASAGMAVGINRDVVGDGVVTSAKAVVATKNTDLTGDGIITGTHPVQATRSFDLVGDGTIDGSICAPYDSLPDGGGGGTTVRPVLIFED